MRNFNLAGLILEVNLGECHEPETHLIPLAIALVIKDKLFKVFGNNFNTYDSGFVRDYMYFIYLADSHLSNLQRFKNVFFIYFY